MEWIELGSLGTIVRGFGDEHENLTSSADVRSGRFAWLPSHRVTKCDDCLALREGDVVGALEGTSEWDVVPNGFVAFAGDGVVAVRLAAESPVPPGYVASFLRFSTQRDEVTSEEDLRSRLVPIPALNRDEVARLIEGLASVRLKLRDVQGEIELREQGVWGSNSTQDLAKNLRELAFHAAATSSAVSSLAETDALLGLEQLPYPAAAQFRAAATTLDSRDEYDGILRFGSHLGVFLGAAAMSWAHENNRLELTEDFRRALHRGGVSYGHWLNVARAIGEVVSAQTLSVTLKDLFLPGRGSLQESLGELLAERNLFAHGAGPRRVPEMSARVRDLWPVARRARFAAARLREHPLVIVVGSTVLRRRRGDSPSRYAIDLSVDLAMGDNPTFVKQKINAENPIPIGAVCLVVGDGLLNLDPFVISIDCPQCRRREIVHVDRVMRSGLRYRSLETNHEFLDPERKDDLAEPEPPASGMTGDTGEAPTS